MRSNEDRRAFEPPRQLGDSFVKVWRNRLAGQFAFGTDGFLMGVVRRGKIVFQSIEFLLERGGIRRPGGWLRHAPRSNCLGDGTSGDRRRFMPRRAQWLDDAQAHAETRRVLHRVRGDQFTVEVCVQLIESLCSAPRTHVE